MLSIMATWRDIELRHLRYFIALGEELHFGRAAKRLYLSQPSLSYAMSQLEERLGSALIDRSNRRRLRLTPAGEALLAYARELDTQVEAAFMAVQRLSAAQGQQLRVGYNDGEPLAQRPSVLRDAMADASLTVSFRRLAWGAESAMVRRGEVDVLLARLPIDSGGLRVDVVHTEPRCLCLQTRHPLARRRSLRAADLLDIPMVRPIGGSPAWREYWRGIPDGSGLDGPEVHSPEETFDIVASGRAGCLVPRSMAVEGDLPVRFIPVKGIEPSELAVVWKGKGNKQIRRFAEVVRALVDRR